MPDPLAVLWHISATTIRSLCDEAGGVLAMDRPERPLLDWRHLQQLLKRTGWRKGGTRCGALLDMEKPHLQHSDPGLGKARGIDFIPIDSAARNPRSVFIATLIL